jgi:hypothetical protein
MMRNVLKFITTERDHHRAALKRAAPHVWALTKSAGADPQWLNEWIAKYGPYFYHRTTPGAYESIMRQGLLPHDTEGVGSKYKEELVPRANHSYIQTIKRHALEASDPFDDSSAQIGVDLRKLNPDSIHADEDAYFGMASQTKHGIPYTYTRNIDDVRAEAPDANGDTYWVEDDTGRRYKHWGHFADANNLNEPHHTAHSFNHYGTAAVEGGVPPEALVPMNRVREDLQQNFPHVWAGHMKSGPTISQQHEWTGGPTPIPPPEYDYAAGDVVSDPLNPDGHGVVEHVKPGDILVVKHEDGSITEGHAGNFEPIGGPKPQWYQQPAEQQPIKHQQLQMPIQASASDSQGHWGSNGYSPTWELPQPLKSPHFANDEWTPQARPLPRGLDEHWLTWEPGTEGKGFILDNGRVWTWPTQGLRPMHLNRAAVVKAKGGRVKPGSAFHITPEGGVFSYGPGRKLTPQDHGVLAMADLRLRPSAPPAVQNTDGYGHSQNIYDKLKTMEARVAMPVTPEGWGLLNVGNPYVYHSTDAAKHDAIMQHGLIPWDHPSNQGGTVYNNPRLRPRPGHTYVTLDDPGKHGYGVHDEPVVYRINVNALDPKLINPDEDSMGNHDDNMHPGESYGDHANRIGYGDDTDETESAIRYFRALAYRGVIPPEALTVHHGPHWLKHDNLTPGWQMSAKGDSDIYTQGKVTQSAKLSDGYLREGSDGGQDDGGRGGEPTSAQQGTAGPTGYRDPKQDEKDERSPWLVDDADRWEDEGGRVGAKLADGVQDAVTHDIDHPWPLGEAPSRGQAGQQAGGNPQGGSSSPMPIDPTATDPRTGLAPIPMLSPQHDQEKYGAALGLSPAFAQSPSGSSVFPLGSTVFPSPTTPHAAPLRGVQHTAHTPQHPANQLAQWLAHVKGLRADASWPIADNRPSLKEFLSVGSIREPIDSAADDLTRFVSNNPGPMSREEWEAHPNTLWHGTPFGMMGPGEIHVGTKDAAYQALRARMLGHGDYQNPDKKYWDIGEPIPASGFIDPWNRQPYWPGQERGIQPHELNPTLIPVQINGAIHPETFSDVPQGYDDYSEDGEFGWEAPLREHQNTAIPYENSAEDAGSISYVVPHRGLLTTYEDYLRAHEIRGSHMKETARAPGWTRGLLAPDGKVHLWPEEEATHGQMLMALGVNHMDRRKWQHFTVDPENQIGPYYLDDDQAAAIMKAKPHIKVLGYPYGSHAAKAASEDSPYGVTLETMKRDGYSDEDIQAWADYLAYNNEADRDSGELDDVSDEQVERWYENWESEGRPRVGSHNRNASDEHHAWTCPDCQGHGVTNDEHLYDCPKCGGQGVVDYDPNDQYYYHRAPTEDRARIQQHGLQPSNPHVNPSWEGELDNSDQPSGVYMTKDPQGWGGVIEPHDVWRIPKHLVPEAQPDPLLTSMGDAENPNHFVTPHPVMDAELHSPWEFNPRSERDWMQGRQPNNLAEQRARMLELPSEIRRKQMGIGLPDRVIGSTKTADFVRGQKIIVNDEQEDEDGKFLGPHHGLEVTYDQPAREGGHYVTHPNGHSLWMMNHNLGAKTYYYHQAPTADRARIQTHGLMAADPRLNHDMGFRQKEPVVHAVRHPDDLKPYHDYRHFSQPHDIWRFESDPYGEPEHDPDMAAGWTFRQNIDPRHLELVEPWEHSDLAHIRTPELDNNYKQEWDALDARHDALRNLMMLQHKGELPQAVPKKTLPLYDLRKRKETSYTPEELKELEEMMKIGKFAFMWEFC